MTQDHQGLVGVVRSAAGKVRKPNAVLWIVRFLAAAGLILIAKKAEATPDWGDAAVVFLIGSAVLLSEYYMGGEFIAAWKNREPLKTLGIATVYTIVLGYAGLQWTGTASEIENQRSNDVKKAHYESELATTEVDRLRGKVVVYKTERDRIHAERWQPLPSVAGQPVQSGADARELVQSYEANTKFFVNITKQCSETKGPDSRKFCAEYRQARAAVAASNAREAKQVALEAAEKNLEAAEKEYNAAMGKKGSTKTVSSGERAELRFLTKYGNMSEETASDIVAAWKIGVISVLLFILGMMEKAKEFAGQPKKPWGVRAAFRRMMWGGKKDSGGDTITTPAVHHAAVDHPTANVFKTTVGNIAQARLEAFLARQAA